MLKTVTVGTKCVLFGFIILLSSCSWHEDFFVCNESISDIIFEYELKPHNDGFPIFENKPTLYKLNLSGSVDWKSGTAIVDLDTNKLSVKVILPPNSIIRFGSLSNDHYEKHNQYFINGRVFNLKSIMLEHNDTKTLIVAETFDDFFAKDNLGITYKIK